ncbi:hypothetical protein GCM10010174_36290 [Kutzneria viridogrisea]
MDEDSRYAEAVEADFDADAQLPRWGGEESPLAPGLQRRVDAALRAQAYLARRRAERERDLAMRTPVSMPGTNYASYEHEDLKAMVTENMDPTQVHHFGQVCNEVGVVLTDLHGELAKAVAASANYWQGEAADRARAAIMRLADSALENGHAAKYVSDKFAMQGEAAELAKNAMPEVVQYSNADALRELLRADPFEIGSTVAAIEQRFTAKQNARLEAARVMSTMEASLGDSVRAMPLFRAPEHAVQGTGVVDHSGTTPVVPQPQPVQPKVTVTTSGTTEPPSKSVPDRLSEPTPSQFPVTTTDTQGSEVPVPPGTAGLPGTTAPSSAGSTGLPTTIGLPGTAGLPGSGTGLPGATGLRGGSTGRPGSTVGRPGGTGLPGSVTGRPGATARPGAATGPGGAAGRDGLLPPVDKSKRKQDGEHQQAQFLKQEHDEFWFDGVPSTAPPVIGED